MATLIEVPFVPRPRTATPVERNAEDWALVVKYMHHSGECSLEDDEFWAVYCEADGFGYCDSETLEEINDGYDWSHIRDSSPEGVSRMANLLRSWGLS